VDIIKQKLKETNNIKIFTPNPSIVLKTRKSKKNQNIINSADILIADGIGLVHASKILKDPIPQRVAGIDIGERILEIANEDRLSLFLLGGTKDTIRIAARKISEKYKNINIAGIHHGYFNENSDYNEKLVNHIKTLNPDIIFVCMGFPKQELWISKNSNKIPSLKLSIGLGGSLDVWSEKVKRAPKIFQKLNSEWLWRMMIQPQRLINLWDIPCFYYFILQQKVKASKKQSKKW
jgi:N-acetylglucosaminyldiphosphoundecaprenol N-acetyl-beta-D-mannosaminyltransferase